LGWRNYFTGIVRPELLSNFLRILQLVRKPSAAGMSPALMIDCS
jgi:hypothetical protein